MLSLRIWDHCEHQYLVQCCAYSVGQAAQPIISINHGAKQGKRIQETLKYALQTVAISLACCGQRLYWPCPIYSFVSLPRASWRVFWPLHRAFYEATDIVPIAATEYFLLHITFQSIMKAGASFFVSVARGIVISGIMIYMLPQLFGGSALWFAMPITEVIVAVVVVFDDPIYA